MLGAGVFGFMINPSLALFYIQGLNTTPVHDHAALFGVYRFLSMGFVLIVLHYSVLGLKFNEKFMRPGVWGLNVGLMLLIVTSPLPIGLN